MGDLLEPSRFERLVRSRLVEANAQLQALGEEPFDADELLATLQPHVDRLAPYITDTSLELDREHRKGRGILFEGAQGTLLDVDHGTYPFVTSSNTTAAMAATGAGIGPGALHEVIGITKAYATRVGAGPFPTELHDEVGQRLRDAGQEYGTVTGRPRRCGWVDAVVLRYAARVNGFWGMALTKMDVLSGFSELQVATAYELDGERLEELPLDGESLERVQPIYETLPGWEQPLDDCRTWEELPDNARAFVRRLEELSGVPVVAISVGPDRAQTILRKNPFDRS